MSLPIKKSTAKNFVATDSEISSKTATLPMQRWTTKKCAAVDAEIGSQNCATADPEISSQVLCRCRSRNRQQRWSCFWPNSFFFWVFTFLT
jgi:hypothetical protein